MEDIILETLDYGSFLQQTLEVEFYEFFCSLSNKKSDRISDTELEDIIDEFMQTNKTVQFFKCRNTDEEIKEKIKTFIKRFDKFYLLFLGLYAHYRTYDFAKYYFNQNLIQEYKFSSNNAQNIVTLIKSYFEKVQQKREGQENNGR